MPLVTVGIGAQRAVAAGAGIGGRDGAPVSECYNPRTAMRSGALKVVPVLAFASGAAALTYESLWMRSFGLIFGVTTHAVNVTLVTFMGGLALGSALAGRIRLRRALRAYACVEIGIGVSALLTYPLLRSLPAWYGSILQGSPIPESLAIGLRFAAAGSVILVPTLLLGATFPLLVEVLARGGREFHASLGRLYRINTLGAAAGVFLGAFVLLPIVGVFRTLLSAALANVTVGLVALAAERRRDREPPAAGVHPGGPATQALAGASLPRAFILTAAATGACSFGLEILWTRSLALVIGSSIYSFNLMLIAFLLGIVLGTAIYERLRPRLTRPAAWLAVAVGGAGLLILADVLLVGWLPLLFFNLMRVIPASFAAHQVAGFLLCLLAMLPITTAFGLTFPLLVHLVAMDGRTPQEISGLLYAWNTLGAIIGALGTGFILVPAAGIQASYVWMAALPLLAGALLLAGARSWGAPVRAGCVAALTLAALGLAAWWRPWDLRLMTAGVYKYGPDWAVTAPSGFFWLRDGLRESRTLLFYEEGREAVVSVVRSGDGDSIFVNGKSDGGTSRWDSATQRLLAHVPLLLHPHPRRALVIGWGTGGTAGAAALHSLSDLHVVEIEPAVFRAAHLFAGINGGVDRDPRFRITFDDARTVLLTSVERYDVIISEPSNPWISGVSNLFTEDFYRIALPRLEPDGIFCQWFHYYNMTLDDIRTQVRTFTHIFPHASLWVIPPPPPGEGPSKVGGDVLLIGGRVPILLDVARVRGRFADEAIARSLAAAGARDPIDLLLDRVMEGDDLRAFAGEGRRNTDDRPVIEFSAPRGLFLGTGENARIYGVIESGSRDAVPSLIDDPGAPAPAGPKERAAAYVRLAQALQRKAMLERAARLLREAIALDGESAAARAALGEILYIQKRPDEAERALAEALRQDAGLERPYVILGFLYLERRDLAAARRMFDALTRRFPDDATGYYGQALLDVEDGQWARSGERLRKALALRPDFDQARALLDEVERRSPAPM